MTEEGEQGEEPGGGEPGGDVRLPGDERALLARAYPGDGGGAPAEEMGPVAACAQILQRDRGPQALRALLYRS